MLSLSVSLVYSFEQYKPPSQAARYIDVWHDLCPVQWRVWQHIHTTAPASLSDTHEGQGQDAILLSHQNFRSCWFQWVTCLFLTISILYFTSCFFILAASGTMEKNVLEDFLREARIAPSSFCSTVCNAQNLVTVQHRWWVLHTKY